MQHRVTPIAALVATLCVCSAAYADDKHQHPPYEAPASFAPFQQLEGEWVGTMTHDDGHAQEAEVTYHATAAGSAVVETLFAGQPDEMVTVYFAEGDKPMLTHYCALANQPTMAGVYDPEANTVTFEYVEGTNIADPSQPHMHGVVFEFVDDDHIRTTWRFYADGEPAGQGVLELRRKAASAAPSER